MPEDLVVDHIQTVEQSGVKLRESIDDVSGFINLRPKTVQRITSTLPLELGDTTITSAAEFSVTTKEGRNIAQIGFKNNSMLFDDGEVSQEARAEETIHYLHTALNNTLITEKSRWKDQYYEQEARGALFVNDSMAESERAWTISVSDLDNFGKRIGIGLTHAPQTMSEIKEALELKVGKQNSDRKRLTGSMLSAGQCLRIINQIKQIDGEGLSTGVGSHYSEYFKGTETLIRISSDGDRLTDTRSTSLVQDRVMEAETGIQNILSDRVHALLQKPEMLPRVLYAFENADVSVDSIGFRMGELKERITRMGNEELRGCLLSVLRSDCTPNEIIYLSRVTPNWIENMNIIGNLNPNTPEVNSNIIAGIKKDIENVLTSSNMSDIREESARVLVDMADSVQKTASTTASLEVGLMFLMDDLPTEADAKSNLLGNSDYVRQNIEATIKALKQGEFTPANAQFDVADLSKSQTKASRVGLDTLASSFDDPAKVALFQELIAEANYNRVNANTADQIGRWANRQLDMRMMQDGIDITQPIPEHIYKTETAKAVADSLTSINADQDLKIHKHMGDILLEPIAKVLVAQKLGRERSSIYFPEKVLGGYSGLLSSAAFSEWINELWVFAEKARADKQDSGVIFESFFAASTIEEQKKVVDGYLAKRV